MARRRAITLRLSRFQASWLFDELTGILRDYSDREILEPEEDLAARRVVADLECGLALAATSYELEAARLRAITQHIATH